MYEVVPWVHPHVSQGFRVSCSYLNIGTLRVRARLEIAVFGEQFNEMAF
jgi:hypothetical protein